MQTHAKLLILLASLSLLLISPIESKAIKHEANKLYLLKQQSNETSCTWLRQWRHASAQSKPLAQMIYDSVRYYVETCAANDSEAFMVFNHLDGCVSLLYNYKDTNLYNNYREWLIKVLYLNTTDPRYFCSCLSAIMGTYGNRTTAPYNLPNAGLAVMDYIRKLDKCHDPELDSTFAREIRYRHENWLAGDTTQPEITWLPSLDTLGLGFLIHPSSVQSSNSQAQNLHLTSFTSTPNPFIKETSLEFDLNRMSYITIAIYDELGRLVWGDGRGSSLEAGKHTIHLEGSALPHGILYVRISTGFGEVKTVKLVHE